MPWHELITSPSCGAFLILHIVLMAIDPYAKVGWLGALVPGLSEYRTPAIAIGTVTVYAMLITAITAKWTKLLPDGWWLKIHRLSAPDLPGDVGAQRPRRHGWCALMLIYLATGLPILSWASPIAGGP